MNTRSICFFAMALALAGCGRQPGRSTASATSTGPGPATTAQAAIQPSGNPEPVAQAVPPIQATLPPETPPNVSAVEPQRSPFEDPHSSSGTPQSVAVTIPARTRIRVRLAESLDTRNSRPGERFVAYLDEPIVSGDRVVVPKGTTFEGRVTEAKRSGRLKGRAYLGVTLDSFRLHGATYTIATGADVRSSSSHKKRSVAAIGGGSGTGAAIGAIADGGVGALIGAGAGAAAGTVGALITGRKNVRLPAETTLVFSLRSAVTVGS